MNVKSTKSQQRSDNRNSGVLLLTEECPNGAMMNVDWDEGMSIQTEEYEWRFKSAIQQEGHWECEGIIRGRNGL